MADQEMREPFAGMSAASLREALHISNSDRESIFRLEDGLGDILAVLALSDLENDVEHASGAIRELAQRALGRNGDSERG
ncbi:MAG TPA: hypothetical protein VFS18_05640 [Actinomycetota bacterium]|nr:hypothetical protein [Actinomycetota bacterium]